jgi:hypothetical protein
MTACQTRRSGRRARFQQQKGDRPFAAIGVSGATADQDEQCAQAGLDAVKADLNLK